MSGSWRDNDRGMEIDATGSIATNDGAEHPFDGVPAMARLLADMPDARACYAAEWMRFAEGKLNADATRCTSTG